MKIDGTLKKIDNIVQLSDDFKKRDFVIQSVDGSRFELLCFELYNDHCKDIDEYSVGDEITVYFNLKGRKWKDPDGREKYFTTLRAWKIEHEDENYTKKKKNEDEKPKKKRKVEVESDDESRL